jgi:site-specific recombinase XerD
MKLQEAVQNYLSSKVGIVSDKTIAYYANAFLYLTRFFGDDFPVENLTTRDIWRYRAHLLEERVDRRKKPFKLSPVTVKDTLKAARAFFAWLVKEGVIESNPAANIELPKPPRRPRPGISDGDRKKMILAAKESDPRDFAILCFIADTACRLSGLTGLTLENLDIENRCALVVEQGDKKRAVFFSNETADALRNWLDLRSRICVQPGVNTVFVTYGLAAASMGKPIDNHGVYSLFGRLAKKAGVTVEWNPHAWRNAAARNMVNNGAPLSVVQQVLGHESIVVTAQFYADLNSDELHREADKYRWNS